MPVPRRSEQASFNVAAALVQRMDQNNGQSQDGGDQLQCGRGSRAADGVTAPPGSSPCPRCFNVAAALVPRMVARGDVGETGHIGFNVAAALVPRMNHSRTTAKIRHKDASMWPRLSCRGWDFLRFRHCFLQLGFNVAAALVPRMAPG